MIDMNTNLPAFVAVCVLLTCVIFVAVAVVAIHMEQGGDE